MDNYQYCAQTAVALLNGKIDTARVLDFGCGAGQVVGLLRASSISAVGCEAFYGGGTTPARKDIAPFIYPIHNGVVPFPAESFDLVLNNQVMEHVEDLDAALSEICRVAKPGGIVLSLFPDKAVWREGHCGVPFLHWFPKHSSVRVYYAYAMRSIGFGHFTQGKSRWLWTTDTCDWLDKWTVYRSYDEIADTYRRYFTPMQHIECQWLEARLGVIARLFPARLGRLFVNKMAGMVFTCTKPQNAQNKVHDDSGRHFVRNGAKATVSGLA